MALASSTAFANLRLTLMRQLKTTRRGQRVTELMKQNMHHLLLQMAVSLYAANEGYLDDVPADKIVASNQHFASFTDGASVWQRSMKRRIQRKIEADLKKFVEDFKINRLY